VTNNLLSPSDVPVGIPLPWSIADSHGRLLLHKGYVIARQITVNSLFANCVCQILAEEDVDTTLVQSEVTSTRFPLDDLCDLSVRLKPCVDEPDAVRDFPATLLSLAAEFQRIVAMDTDLTMGSIFLDLSIEPRLKKILDVAIVCDVVASVMRMTAAARRTLTAAILTLDMGIDLPEVFAAQRLRQLGVTDSDWLNAVMQFHELRHDSQHPSGLGMDHLGLETRLIQLAYSYTDSLCNMQNNESVASYQLMRDIFRESGRSRDPVLGGYFIKALGSYPIGCRVELCNGEAGVVIRRTDNLNCPVVMVLTNAGKRKLRIPVKRDTGVVSYRIATLLSHRQYEPLDPYQLWGYLPFQAHG